VGEIVNTHQAKTHLSKLLQRVELGEDITIARAGKPVARLVPVPPDQRKRTPGRAKGKIIIKPGFYKTPDWMIADFEKGETGPG